MYQVALLEKVIVILINVLGFWLSFWVYRTDKKNRLNQWFFAMTFFIISWVDFGFLGNTVRSYTLSIVFYKLNWVMVILFLISSFYFYVISFLKINYVVLRRIILTIGILLIGFCLFSPLIIKDVVSKPWGNEIVFGWLNNFLNLYALSITLLVAGLLVKKYSSFNKIEKLKTQYFLIGTILFALSNIIFNIIVPSAISSVVFHAFGDYSAIFLLGFTAFAIVKKQLFGIKVIFVQLLVGLIALVLFVNFLASQSIFEYIWKAVLLAGFCYAGLLLVKSFLKETKLKEQLAESYAKIKEFNETLEQKVKERTLELEKEKQIVEQKVEELESFYKLTVGRELKMVELKDKLKTLTNNSEEHDGQ